MFRTWPIAAVLGLLAPAVPAQQPADRAQREAANPLRIIIEASKIKPRAKGAEKPPVRAAAAANAASAAALARATPDLAPAAEPEPLPIVTVEAPAREQPESTVATVEVPAPAPAEPSAMPPTPEPLRLVNLVEPVTPRVLQGVLRGDVLVRVAFTVSADGSVLDPSVRSASHPQMATAVVNAVRQWRYEPITEPRAHEVEIVLRQN